MPRYPAQSSLPSLKDSLPLFHSLSSDRPKVEQVSELLQQVIAENRTTHNLTFYSTRDIAGFFQVSQNTATLSVQRLELAGLLRRIRGSQTVMLGKEIITRTQIRAVAGMMSWIFAQRFSETQQGLTRLLGESLWPHQVALDIIPHYDLGDCRPDLDETLKKHLIDFAIWPFPFSHHKDHILYLQDRGIRSLVIGVEGVRSPFKTDILIDYRSAYEQIIYEWKARGIRRVIVVNPAEYVPRKRIKLFAAIAAKGGMDCCVEKNHYELPEEVLAREDEQVGIALLDEHSMVEFTFYNPKVFEELASKHRILYGMGNLNVPFVPNGELKVDRIFIPMNFEKTHWKHPLIPAIVNTINRWSFGDFSAKPARVDTRVWMDSKLWRYL